MSRIIPASYFYTRRKRAVFCEIYFPKKGRYQGRIFDTLRYGLDRSRVEAYLLENVESILSELSAYPSLLDPTQYEWQRLPVFSQITVPQAEHRIRMYESHLYGWSMYEVDGTFLSEKRGTVDEERTQVLRLIFRFDSQYEQQAREANCLDVLIAIISFAMEDQSRIDTTLRWGKEEKARFLALHKPWSQEKLAFVNAYFELAVKEVKKWTDDTALLIFGYLVKNFWQQVQESGNEEDEIWVTTLFSMNVNSVQQQRNGD